MNNCYLFPQYGLLSLLVPCPQVGDRAGSMAFMLGLLDVLIVDSIKLILSRATEENVLGMPL